MPGRIHKSPVALEAGGGLVTVSVLVGGSWVEPLSLLTGVEEDRQPMPNIIHRSPVVLGGGASVVEGG
jgi:hypothetical protein